MLKVKPLKIRKKCVVIIIILLLAGAFFLDLRPKKQEALEFTKVRRGDIKSILSASGTLNGKDAVNLKFKSSGKLSFVNVKQGDRVQKGQTVAGLDTQDLSIALQQARNTLVAKQAAAQKVEDDVKGHDSDETFAQKQSRTQAQAESNNAFDNVKAAERAFQDVYILSPINGIVTETKVLPGQFVSASDVVAQIVDWSAVYFDAEIDESDLANISLGQDAEVSLNAYPNQIFKGTVEVIPSQTETTSSGATIIKIRININQPAIHLISGLNGQVEITSSSKTNVLTVPQESIRGENEVLANTRNGITPVIIKTGIRSDTDIEITEGLEENQEILNNPQIFKDNERRNNLFNRIFRSFRRN